MSCESSGVTSVTLVANDSVIIPRNMHIYPNTSQCPCSILVQFNFLHFYELVCSLAPTPFLFQFFRNPLPLGLGAIHKLRHALRGGGGGIL